MIKERTTISRYLDSCKKLNRNPMTKPHRLSDSQLDKITRCHEMEYLIGIHKGDAVICGRFDTKGWLGWLEVDARGCFTAVVWTGVGTTDRYPLEEVQKASRLTLKYQTYIQVEDRFLSTGLQGAVELTQYNHDGSTRTHKHIESLDAKDRHTLMWILKNECWYKDEDVIKQTRDDGKLVSVHLAQYWYQGV